MSDETREFAGGFSWRGGTIDIARGATDHVTIGASFGWHVLSEENTGTSVFPDGAISGRALRHVNSVPLMVTGTLALGSRDGIQPWFGVGGGTVWIESRTESGALAAEDVKWHRGAMGEVGLRIPRESGATITLSARYQRAFETNGLEREYMTFSVGSLLGG
jgi:CubicO group peptidase (beta-lactamase class C family)